MSDQLTIPEPAAQAPAPKRSAFEITADLRQRLRARYGAGDGRRYVVLEEVANATGAGASRSCDLLAISLWPSDGLDWHGHALIAKCGPREAEHGSGASRRRRWRQRCSPERCRRTWA